MMMIDFVHQTQIIVYFNNIRPLAAGSLMLGIACLMML